MEEKYKKTIKSPLGLLCLESNTDELVAIRFTDKEENTAEENPEILTKTESQLNEYFNGKRFLFELKLNPEGTEFQKKVWNLVKDVPFGETTTYNTIAKKLGDKKYIRAVGMANGKNPIPIVIPCHRIIGSDGRMVGYAGGIERKKLLLLHEINFLKKGILF